jgi:predicted membrane protein
MLDQLLPYLLPFISLIIALILFALVYDDFRFNSDAERAAALICLIAFSLIFYQIFLLFAILVGLTLMFTYAGVKIYALYKSKNGGIVNTRRRRNINFQHPLHTIQSNSEREIDVSKMSLKMDLTEEQ